MRGSAVPTMLWSSAASSIPASTPTSTTRICWWERLTCGSCPVAAAATGRVAAGRLILAPRGAGGAPTVFGSVDRLALLGGLDLDLDLDVVADQEAAGFEGGVPAQTEL